MEVIVRVAELKDASGIAKVHIETWQSAYKNHIPESYLSSLSVEQKTESWKKMLEKQEGNATTIVAEAEGRIVGFCSVDQSRSDDMGKDTGELWAIYVHNDYAGKGVGTLLLNEGMDILRGKGFQKAILWVLTSNISTRKWYESKGWMVEGKTTIDKRDGLELQEMRYIIEL